MNFREKDWSKIETLSLNSLSRIQELQNEVDCMDDSRNFAKMLNQHAMDYPMFPVNQCCSHLIQFLVECKAVLWECQAAAIGRQTFGTCMVYRETFLKIQRRLLQHLIRKGSIGGFLLYQNTHLHMCMSERQTSKKKVSLEGNASSKRRPFPSWKTDRLPDLRVLPGHWSQRCCRELCRPIYSCLSE